MYMYTTRLLRLVRYGMQMNTPLVAVRSRFSRCTGEHDEAEEHISINHINLMYVFCEKKRCSQRCSQLVAADGLFRPRFDHQQCQHPCVPV